MEVGYWQAAMVVLTVLGGIVAFELSPTEDPSVEFRVTVSGLLVAFCVLVYPPAFDASTKLALAGLATCFGAATAILGRRKVYRDPNGFFALLKVCASTAIVVAFVGFLAFLVEPGTFTREEVGLFLAVALLLAFCVITWSPKTGETANASN